MKITIESIKVKTFNSHIDRTKHDYALLSMHDYVRDSSVINVYISQHVLLDVIEWVRKEKKKGGDIENEIGGFLIGNFEEIERGFDVAIDQFFPASNVISSSPSHIRMGSRVFSQLDEFLLENEESCLVGWFHTHPGFGPYLSDRDLNQFHELLFKNSYSIAVVLDSKTSSYDTGFFTRKSTGDMNNKKEYSNWIKWKTLVR